jgi:hypothetical protein
MTGYYASRKALAPRRSCGHDRIQQASDAKNLSFLEVSNGSIASLTLSADVRFAPISGRLADGRDGPIADVGACARTDVQTCENRARISQEI